MQEGGKRRIVFLVRIFLFLQSQARCHSKIEKYEKWENCDRNYEHAICSVRIIKGTQQNSDWRIIFRLGIICCLITHGTEFCCPPVIDTSNGRIISAQRTPIAWRNEKVTFPKGFTSEDWMSRSNIPASIAARQ